jgi:transketolase
MTAVITPVPVPAPPVTDPRRAYHDALVSLLDKHSDVLCLDSDTGLFRPDDFGASADRYLNLGICEQNLIGVAAGLAAAGKQPFVSTMAAFASLRAVEAVRNDVARNGLPVRIAATHSGLSAAHLGPTHHSLEDLAVMRLLPSMTVVVPADAAAVTACVQAAVELPGPLYLRLGRAADLELPGPPPVLGQAQWLRSGSDLAIVACGPHPVAAALAAAGALATQGIQAAVVNLHTIKPLDVEAVLRAAATGLVVSVEEHWLGGGLAGLLAETFAAHLPTRLVAIGVPDAFVDIVGDHEHLLDQLGIEPVAIARAATEALVRQQKSPRR